MRVRDGRVLWARRGPSWISCVGVPEAGSALLIDAPGDGTFAGPARVVEGDVSNDDVIETEPGKVGASLPLLHSGG